MPGRITSRRVAGRPAALLVSAAFHAGLVLVLAYHLAQGPTYTEPPVIQVTLVPSLRNARDAPDDPKRREVRPRAARIDERPAAAILPPVLPTPPERRPTGEDELGGRGREALRGLRGCERGGLSKEEREGCETRRWAAASGAPAPRLRMDPTGRYAEDGEPFLSKRPEKGCRVRATGDVDGMGDSGNMRAGVTCVIRF